MIRLHVPGFSDNDFTEKEIRDGEARLGDAQIIDDGKYYVVIDGYCGKGTTRLINALKERKITRPYLYITHAHYDHYYGVRQIIRDDYFKPRALYCYDPAKVLTHLTNEIRSNISALQAVIEEARKKKIPVKYIDDGDKITHGEIKIEVYRRDTEYDGNSEGYVNDRSIALWFPELRYLTTGDGATRVGDLKPKFIKIGHHGNYCPRVQATWLKNNGCIFCWDNDYATTITDFLETGREDCIGVGMKYLDCHGDLNAIFFGRRAVIYKRGQIYRYSCSYSGKAALEGPNLTNVKAVLRGDAGTDDARVTYLLNHAQNPGLIQQEINELYSLIRG